VLLIPAVFGLMAGSGSFEIVGAVVPNVRDRAWPGVGSGPGFELQPALEQLHLRPPPQNRLGVDVVEVGVREGRRVSILSEALHRGPRVAERTGWVEDCIHTDQPGEDLRREVSIITGHPQRRFQVLSSQPGQSLDPSCIAQQYECLGPLRGDRRGLDDRRGDRPSTLEVAGDERR
jgi:hypothetical protein